MTTHAALQQYLKDTGRYTGAIDGDFGRISTAATLVALTDGPDTALTEGDYESSALRLRVPVAHVKAIATVEAAGAGFQDGRPKILPERHIFSRLTGGVYDKKYPTLSYPKWGTRPYPGSQDARYDLLMRMVALDVDAGFGACSYGKFQILGSNFKACGYGSEMEFAFAMARDERTQLLAFEAFILANGILPALKAGRWAEVARKYNGSAYAANQYDKKLAAAARSFGA